MIGAIAGDIIGSSHETFNTKNHEFKLYDAFSRYTDDTVLTVATAACIWNNGNFDKYYRSYFFKYPFRRYGTKFSIWALLNQQAPYNSMGNGSAMRVSPAGFAAKSLDKALILAEKTAIVTHNHPDGIKGTKAVSAAIFLSKNGLDKEYIKQYIESTLEYNLSSSYEELKKSYKGSGTCSGSVPQAIICFLFANSYEETIRNAVSIGGDSDTIACIAGNIAEAYFKKIPDYILDNTYKRLNKQFILIIHQFQLKYMTDIYPEF